MSASVAASVRTQLEDRRRRLQSVVGEVGPADDLVRLLHAVDDALVRLDTGRYGQCDVCHERVEDELLLAHPLIQYCLCALSPQQQADLEHDLGLARRVQLSLLPSQNFVASGWAAHFRYQPAGPVSGDYLDVVACDGGERPVYFLLGDVAGKGVAASLRMAQLSATIRGLVGSEPPPGELVERANEQLSRTGMSTQFATLVCARATPAGDVELCNAGHCPPLVARGGRVDAMDSGGFPVGLAFGDRYDAQALTLASTDTLLLYSDGITEAMDPHGRQFGVERLVDCLEAHHALGPAALAAACLSAVADFRGRAPSHDDVSLMVVRRG